MYILKLSSRDPNSMATLEAFERSIDWAAKGMFTDSDIDDSKITVFQQVCTVLLGMSLICVFKPLKNWVLSSNELFTVKHSLTAFKEAPGVT